VVTSVSLSSDELGGRLPLTDPATLTQPQQQLFDSVVANQLPWANDAGFRIRTADGRLIGPFNTFLLRPEVAVKFLAFAAAEQSHTALSERVREIAIISVGAVWGADYELYAHKILARQAGLSEAAIEKLADGGLPDELSEPEKTAARVARRLSVDHRIDDALYREAEQVFGRQGLFDLAAVMAQYHAVSTLLTLFAVPAPE
jgi:4-carboxymuconolactone decarboxylase